MQSNSLLKKKRKVHSIIESQDRLVYLNYNAALMAKYFVRNNDLFIKITAKMNFEWRKFKDQKSDLKL